MICCDICIKHGITKQGWEVQLANNLTMHLCAIHETGYKNALDLLTSIYISGHTKETTSKADLDRWLERLLPKVEKTKND